MKRPSQMASDIATNEATAATIGGRKQAELEQLTLGNRKAAGTLASDIARKLVENAWTISEKSGPAAAMAELQRGSALAGVMAQAWNSSGPAGASQVVEALKAKGVDVSGSPMIEAIQNSRTPEEASA